MKNEDAIKWLIKPIVTSTEVSPTKAKELEAYNMAIEALSAEDLQGEWIDKGEYAECSICGAHSGTQFDGVEPIPLKTNFCPNCGAIMKRSKR